MKKSKTFFLFFFGFILGISFLAIFEGKLRCPFLSGTLTAEMRASDGRDEIGFCKECKNNFYFILKAWHGDVSIYEEWNSWGWFARSFTMQDATDSKQRYVIARRRGTWDRNFPSTKKIKSGDILITDINLCDRTWTVEPKLDETKDHDLILQGHFDIRDDMKKDPGELDGIFGVSWNGHLDTNVIKVSITKEYAKILNHPIEW